MVVSKSYFSRYTKRKRKKEWRSLQSSRGKKELSGEERQQGWRVETREERLEGQVAAE
jgi:hypothetical protein